jgi:uncharacterized protein with HEPN domain
MIKSAVTDATCLRKLLRYQDDIIKCFDHFNISSAADLQNENLAKYAITQLITNMHELRKNLSDETQSKIPLFMGINLKEARNIISHSYNKVDFNQVYSICIKLTEADVIAEIQQRLEDVKNEKRN